MGTYERVLSLLGLLAWSLKMGYVRRNRMELSRLPGPQALASLCAIAHAAFIVLFRFG